MSRNRVEPETAENNRTGKPGGYTFNAYPPEDYEGRVLVVAAIRLGDHAHLTVDTGRQVVGRNCEAVLHRGEAGRLVMGWEDWLVFRAILAAWPYSRIAEVENPREEQINLHTAASGNEATRASITGAYRAGLKHGEESAEARDATELSRALDVIESIVSVHEGDSHYCADCGVGNAIRRGEHADCEAATLLHEHGRME